MYYIVILCVYLNNNHAIHWYYSATPLCINCVLCWYSFVIPLCITWLLLCYTPVYYMVITLLYNMVITLLYHCVLHGYSFVIPLCITWLLLCYTTVYYMVITLCGITWLLLKVTVAISGAQRYGTHQRYFWFGGRGFQLHFYFNLVTKTTKTHFNYILLNYIILV